MFDRDDIGALKPAVSFAFPRGCSETIERFLRQHQSLPESFFLGGISSYGYTHRTVLSLESLLIGPKESFYL
jgi:hypothetical protein